jgi:hypothetical protein
LQMKEKFQASSNPMPKTQAHFMDKFYYLGTLGTHF